MNMIPASRPKLTQIQALEHLKSFAGLDTYRVKLLGIRGYYKESMGVNKENEIGIYDDAVFIITPDSFASFNFNTDPSHLKPGTARVKPGTMTLYKIGMHNMKAPYEALRQHGRVTVTRAGKTGEFTDTAAAPFYIDIHKGGYSTTSSLGCQTVPPEQWPAFLAMVKDQMKRYNQDIVPYYLKEV